MIVEDWRRGSLLERTNLALFAGFMVVAFLFGGASRADALSQVVVRVAAIIVIAAAICQWPQVRDRIRGMPFLLILAVAGIILLQLIPLPPMLWRNAPGRDLYIQALDLAGLGRNWHALTLTPDATLNSLMATLPVIATFAGAALVNRRNLEIGLYIALAAAALSAVFGVLQVAGALQSFYQISNPGSSVGLFANRNHQAVFLVCTLPLLAAWVALPVADHRTRRMRRWLALCCGALIFPLLLVSESRGGVIFGAIAGLASLALIYTMAHRHERAAMRGWRGILVIGFMIVVPALLVVFAARDQGLQRLLDHGSGGELRVGFLGIYWQMAKDFFPWGAGFGAFDPTFRAYEPYAALRASYLNHAHNDLLELLIDGGLPAALMLIAFVAWVVRKTYREWRKSEGASPLARAASIILVIVLAWSVLDYPLRTPLIAVLAAFCCLLLSNDDRHVSSGEKRSLGNREGLR